MRKDITKNMRNFIDANEKSRVYYGDGTSEGVVYRLVSGQSFLLSKADVLSAPHFTPKWEGVNYD